MTNRFRIILSAVTLALLPATLGAQKIVFQPYGDNIMRVFSDPSGGPLRDPEANPPAQIVVAKPSGKVVEAAFDGGTAVKVLGMVLNVKFTPSSTELSIEAAPDEYFYGGGVQNGRFSHRGKTIAIENQNSWTDGGVSSPAPWFWSTGGYAILWNTFTKGSYSFLPGKVTLSHDTPYLDVFVMKAQDPEGLLKAYYSLTGAPVLLPRFGFYEGHLNAYNRDWWAPAPEGRGVPFEDGKRYVESQSDNGGIRESLNGELPGNYQFSARAVIDRYRNADMPLGWILPNDGYGAGYGQTGTLDGNIANLREFGEYARSNGVEIGLWTQSDLHPVDSIPALLQRDMEKEVGVAGVRVLKTDVAWVYRGYSFGLNGIADAASIMSPYGRPFIITLDGWAGTQRYAGIWTGDQTGGEWEYIRFHIPTYIGAGLSGQPNVSSDMDGIFGGGSEWVNIRDFQWKTFTPMQLNMDGWGAREKYPQALGERAASINRRYLKLKSELMPYTYSIAYEATRGLPMIRAMLLEEANPYTLGTATRYQFMYGPSLLVAPVYKETAPDASGNDIRDNIYLPEGEWLDFFTDEPYSGGRILCNFPAPIDKIPVFVKRGAIIPLAAPHNNPSQQDLSRRIYAIYPHGQSTFTEYDDDGRTTAYLKAEFATTLIESSLKGNKLSVVINPTAGGYGGMVRNRTTELRIHTAAKPSGVKLKVNGAKSVPEYTYEGGVCTVTVPELDITMSLIELTMSGFKAPAVPSGKAAESTRPSSVPSISATANSISLKWLAGIDYREVSFDGMLYTGIRRDTFVLEDLVPDTEYTIRTRDLGGRWEEFSVKTGKDPLEHAIKGITGSCTAGDQPGQEISQLFDGSVQSEMWHTRWDSPALPFEITADLGATYTLDRLEYVPRADAGNGTILRGSVSTSADGKQWTSPELFRWERDANTKKIVLGGVQARFVRISASSSVGGFGSGRELYIFRVPGTGSYRHGVFNEKGEAVESID